LFCFGGVFGEKREILVPNGYRLGEPFGTGISLFQGPLTLIKLTISRDITFGGHSTKENNLLLILK